MLPRRGRARRTGGSRAGDAAPGDERAPLVGLAVSSDC